MRIGPFGVWEILIILVVVLLIFGPRRLPEMAKGLGQSVREFRREMRNFKDDMDADDRPTKPTVERPAETAPVSGEGESATARSTHPESPRNDERARDDERVRDDGDKKPV